MTSTANTLFHAAQGYIRQGQPVFPCIPAGVKAKAPLTANGFKDATLNVSTVRGWFKRHGAFAIGLPTGRVYDVLDVDIKDDSDGRLHMRSLKELGLLNGCKRVARTPSGGWHLYFRAAPGLTNKARSASLGLDMRAVGGYVIAPPSYIETPDYAGTYDDHGQTTGSTDEPLYWDLIVSALAPINTLDNKPVLVLPSDRQASVASLREWVANLKQGERNNGLHWAVCRCIENGIDPHELVDPALLAGLAEEETLLTVRSALKRAGITAEELETEVEAMFGHDDVTV